MHDIFKRTNRKMLAVTLDPKMEQELEKLATTTGHSKGFYVHEALSEYLDTRTDYLLALAALEQEEPRTSLADVRRELGLES